MSATPLAPDCSIDALHSQALALFAQGNYAEAATLWQQMADDGIVAAHWHLGLSLLLQGQESEAQLVWMTPLLEADSDQVEQWTADLHEILVVEADRQTAQDQLESAWLIRQHLRELGAADLTNLLNLLLLDLERSGEIDPDLLAEVTTALSNAEITVSPELLLEAIAQVLTIEPDRALPLIEASITHLPQPPLIDLLLEKAGGLFLTPQTQVAADLGKICVRLKPDDLNLLRTVIPFLQSVDGDEIWLSIQLGEQCLAQSSTLVEKALAAQGLLTSLMTASGQHPRAVEVYQTYKTLLMQIVQVAQAAPNADEKLGSLVKLLTCGLFFFYFEDHPRENRSLRNSIGQLAQSHLNAHCNRVYAHSPRSSSRLLRVGYLSESLRRHSVGWLIRWLFKHHLESDRVEVHLYSTRQTGDPLQQAFLTEFGDRFHSLPSNAPQIADQIYRDEIDVLVEIDSLTSFVNCAATALKPAPVQINWLGYDAAGLPTTDYFIADPYVLPDDAQDYYSERIWRMPQTYIAIDGFEVSAPSLRRDQLEIPSDAIVYFSSQIGLKRNPANVQRQMQILKAVPNSYFLIKSIKADQAMLEAFFAEMAEAAGVSPDRLRFLPRVASEAVHRGNLAIADVVLDTFPYTGATTTLETLWMGIPLVTQVGQQFAARNSYAMLKNVGVEAGIAWTPEEYVEWGIRLGTDEALRQQVSWQLKRSRQTSPLWNARQFTQELETAYEQMWNRSR
jgi:predicted O-linked N-acetylglucosamine transferase (SPINDLY family)